MGRRGQESASALPSSNRGVSEFRNAYGTLTVGIDWFPPPSTCCTHSDLLR